MKNVSAKINKHEMYEKAYFNTLKLYGDNPTQDIMPVIKKLIVYGVKTINSKEKPKSITREETEYNFQVAEIIKDFMGCLTPREFVNLFPVVKEYNGEKWQSKDYFYTMNYIKTLEPNAPIGEKITDFLWEYHNWEVSIFLVNLMGYVSDLRRLDGHKGLIEEFCDNNGIKTYTMHTDEAGKQYIVDNQTGKTSKVKKPKPRYLKMVGGSWGEKG